MHKYASLNLDELNLCMGNFFEENDKIFVIFLISQHWDGAGE